MSEHDQGNGLKRDAAGKMTDDGRNYGYVWDGFGRQRQVKKTTDQALVAEYRYNGLGHRVSWNCDTGGDLDVDGSDKTCFFVYDLKWRPVAARTRSPGNGSSSTTPVLLEGGVRVTLTA